MVVADHDPTSRLCSQHDGKPEGDVAGIRVRVDCDQQFDVVFLDVVNELLGERERLPPHLVGELARHFAAGGKVLVEQTGEPLAVTPLVPAVGAGQLESLPRWFEHGVDPVAEVAGQAMDRHAGQEILETLRVLGDLHGYAVDVVGERDEGNTTGDRGAKVGRPRFVMMPGQVVEDGADALAVVDVPSLKVLDAHLLPGSLGFRGTATR